MRTHRFCSKTMSFMAAALLAGATFALTAPLSVAAGGGHGGTNSASHVNAEMVTNSNGPNSKDRDTGLDRAQDRRSEEGMDHSKAKGDAKKKSNAKNLSEKDKH